MDPAAESAVQAGRGDAVRGDAVRGGATEGEDAGHEGLRERKRAATRAAIERAALTLATEHGYENVTVEAICDAAMISPRTFFNYFGSKVGVFVGTDSPLPPAEAREQYVSRGAEAGRASALGDLVEALVENIRDADIDPEFFQARRHLVQSVPELETAFLAKMADAEGELQRLVLRRLEAQGRSTAATPDLADEARMIVALAMGVIHFTIRAWKRDPGKSGPDDALRRSLDLVHRIIDTP